MTLITIKPIKPGDIVELLPTNQRNRQLRKQDGKHEWVVIKIDPSVICFNGNEGLLIQSNIDRKHDRWVQRHDIKLTKYRENLIADE